MNKKIKVLSSVMCGLLLSSNLALTSVYAKSNSANTLVNSKQTVSYDRQLSPSSEQFVIAATNEEIDAKLKELGFTKEEIVKLHAIDSKNNYLINTRSKNSIRSGFPSNPKMGQTCPMTYTISNSDLGLPIRLTSDAVIVGGVFSQKLIKKIVAKFGATAVLWAPMAVADIIAIINERRGNAGFIINILWYYGEDNHMSIGWTPGPSTIRTYK